MKKLYTAIITAGLALCSLAYAEGAKWISSADNKDEINTWVAFRKDVNIDRVPEQAVAKIAADSKYWLWINGKLAVFEGSLKRGPNPQDGYYDEVDIAPFLKEGDNRIAMLVWYFGKNGFSHKSSGKNGMFFEVDSGDVKIASDSSWLSRVHPAYGTTDAPGPNYRLPESNIRFFADREIDGWQELSLEDAGKNGFAASVELGEWGAAPWGEHQKRPIPQWKLYPVKEAKLTRTEGPERDVVQAALPYNMQMTPIITISDPDGGNIVGIITDHTFAGGDTNLRAECVTKKGVQTYESLGWLNGQNILLDVPKNVTIEKVEYRESGYDAEPSGEFSCDNEFYMEFWKKGLRTLYINMRDTFFDCPDRERAQWWGDTVVLMGESFYTFSTSTHALMSKAMKELVNWAKPDGAIYSPIPSGNHYEELPGQMLASIGKYGFWNYYMNTGDLDTIKEVYPGVKKYLGLWKLDDTGLTAFRKGDWTWGDWGDNRDIRLIFAGWHYLALEAAADMAEALGLPEDAKAYRETMEKVKEGYNKCWTGNAYRHPEYQGATDDRVQALAVISGIAGADKMDAIFNLFQTQYHASPYMEKYVMEALFQMGHGEYALDRTKRRFEKMVNDKKYTTLFEGWDVGGFGGGSTNHAWSGGTLTVLAQYLCGLSPLEPGWKTFRIEPYPAGFKNASISVPTVKGTVKSAFVIDGDKFRLTISVPADTTAMVYMPEFTKDKKIKVNASESLTVYASGSEFKHPEKLTLKFGPGEYSIEAE